MTVTGLPDGGQKKLSDFLGKVVVLEFWTSNVCTLHHFRERYAEIPRKTSQLGRQGCVIALSLDERKEAAEDLLRKKDLESDTQRLGRRKGPTSVRSLYCAARSGH